MWLRKAKIEAVCVRHEELIVTLRVPGDSQAETLRRVFIKGELGRALDVNLQVMHISFVVEQLDANIEIVEGRDGS